MTELPADMASLRSALTATGYLADDGLATALFLAVALRQPLLLEGEPGVGKTRAALALAEVVDTPLVRLQCYEGLTAAEALYEWNHPRQLLAIRLAESRGERMSDDDLFGEEFLLARPLLSAVLHPGPRPAVLLVDEIDRADDEFEAHLLELLAEGAITIPELGTRRAVHRPVVVLTSNRTRELHDALTRRCLHHAIPHPDAGTVEAIIRTQVPGVGDVLVDQVARALARLRESSLLKPPSVAEAIDWARALRALGVERLDADHARRTLGAVVKHEEDRELLLGAGLESVVGGP